MAIVLEGAVTEAEALQYGLDYELRSDGGTVLV
jgi:hypothetical protein